MAKVGSFLMAPLVHRDQRHQMPALVDAKGPRAQNRVAHSLHGFFGELPCHRPSWGVLSRIGGAYQADKCESFELKQRSLLGG